MQPASRLGNVTAMAVAMAALAACGSASPRATPSTQPSQTATPDATALRDSKAEALCTTNVIVWPDAPRGECSLIYQATPTMLVMQGDNLVNNATPRPEADGYVGALAAHGWMLTRSAQSDGDEERWLALSTPVQQCLKVSASPFSRPGLMGVDVSVVYDYVFGSAPCPMD